MSYSRIDVAKESINVLEKIPRMQHRDKEVEIMK